MKKQPDASMKARICGGYCKHLKPFGKRVANKSTRRMGKALLGFALLLLPIGCVQHSPGAKVTTTVNVSIIPPTAL